MSQRSLFLPPFFWLTVMKNNKNWRSVTVKVSRTSFWYTMFLYRTTLKTHLNPPGNAKPMLKSFWKSGIGENIFLSFWIYFLPYSYKWAALQESSVAKLKPKFQRICRNKNSEFLPETWCDWWYSSSQGELAMQNVSSWVSHTEKCLWKRSRTIIAGYQGAANKC